MRGEKRAAARRLASSVNWVGEVDVRRALACLIWRKRATLMSLDIKKLIDQIKARPPPRDGGRDFICPVCGEQVDRQNLAQIDHHSPEPHAPMGQAMPPRE